MWFKSVRGLLALVGVTRVRWIVCAYAPVTPQAVGALYNSDNIKSYPNQNELSGNKPKNKRVE